MHEINCSAEKNNIEKTNAEKGNLENTLNSLSLFIGTGNCNASCAHCAGYPLRKYAPKADGEDNFPLIEKTISECYPRGIKYISISGSGEPILSPNSITRTLELISRYSLPSNIFTNGIRIGTDDAFCREYLPGWKNNGLATMYVTLHSTGEEKNAQIYRVTEYPDIERLVRKICDYGIKVRINLVLNKKGIGQAEQFSEAIDYLFSIGADRISAWPLRDMEDNIHYLAPSDRELDRMERYIGPNVRVIRDNVQNYSRKLTLFQDGSLSNMWCNK